MASDTVHRSLTRPLTCWFARLSTGRQQTVHIVGPDIHSLDGVVPRYDPQDSRGSLPPQQRLAWRWGMGEWVQMALFDASAYARRQFRPTRADNAHKRAGGRLVLAGGLVLDEDGRVLLVHRSTPTMTWWETPGGKIDRGENPRDTTVRELFEELGIDIDIVADLGWHDFESGERPMRYAVYQVKIVAGEPRPREAIFDAAGYFTWNELMDMRSQLSPNARTILEKQRRGKLQLT